MIAHYGYRDASGEYFVSIDAALCTGCAKCVAACPRQAIEMTTVLVGLDEKPVAAVTESSRRDLRHVCGACDHGGGAPCRAACGPKAVGTTWKPA